MQAVHLAFIATLATKRSGVTKREVREKKKKKAIFRMISV